MVQSFVHLTYETNRTVLPDHLKQQVSLCLAFVF